jgi:hypothetical protein
LALRESGLDVRRAVGLSAECIEVAGCERRGESGSDKSAG